MESEYIFRQTLKTKWNGKQIKRNKKDSKRLLMDTESEAKPKGPRESTYLS
jgi:hypothetical protein